MYQAVLQTSQFQPGLGNLQINPTLAGLQGSAEFLYHLKSANPNFFMADFPKTFLHLWP